MRCFEMKSFKLKEIPTQWNIRNVNDSNSIIYRSKKFSWKRGLRRNATLQKLFFENFDTMFQEIFLQHQDIEEEKTD